MPGTGAPKLASDLPTLEREVCGPPASWSQGSWDFPLLSQRPRAVDRPAERPMSPENLPHAGKPASRGPDRHILPVWLLRSMTRSPVRGCSLGLCRAWQYSCLENSMDGRTSRATVRGVTKSRTRLSNFALALAFSLPAPPGLRSPGAVSPRPEPHILCPRGPQLPLLGKLPTHLCSFMSRTD